MAKEEHKIGEIFKCGSLKLKCEKKPENCASYRKCEYCFLESCGACVFLAGHCSRLAREDKFDVIFLKVDE